MKRSIGKKLTTSGLVVLLFILMIFAASQVAVSLFRNTSENLIVEYHELDALKELKLSLSAMLTSSTYYAAHGEEQYNNQFCDEILAIKIEFMNCHSRITERHDKALLRELEQVVTRLDEITAKLLLLSNQHQVGIQQLLTELNSEIGEGNRLINVLLDQTGVEIIEYERKNNTVIRHSTVTFLVLGLLVIVILLYRGFIVIRSVTKPIRKLVHVTEEIGKGNRKARANIHSNDEFAILAQSLNHMVTALDNTTVTRNYLNNIVENMFDALIVTDNSLMIRSANKASHILFSFHEDNYKGKSIGPFFDLDDGLLNKGTLSEEDLDNLRKTINKGSYVLTSDERSIPVSISSSVLRNDMDGADGLIIAVYDRSEQKAIEEKLDHSRKERLIAINEAQEEERMRIATDLHDGLGQILTSVSYGIQELSEKTGCTDEENKETLDNVQRQIDAAIRETKAISHDLIPIILKDFGLIVALENLIRKANDLHETKFQFNAFDFHDRIDPKLEKTIYRISQECLNNIVKHANAKNAMFQIFRQNSNIVFVVEDDGSGFNSEMDANGSSDSGIGLISMNERVASFDGTFTINSAPDFGTEIIIEIPYRKR